MDCQDDCWAELVGETKLFTRSLSQSISGPPERQIARSLLTRPVN